MAGSRGRIGPAADERSHRRGRPQPAPASGRSARVLELQRAAGNTAVAGMLSVQRDDDKSTPLSSPRFAGNARLQAAADGKAPLTPKDPPDIVRPVQEALVAAGHPMPKSTTKAGLDGRWGDEMKRTLRRYQARRALATIDGELVGRETLRSLDKEPQGGGAIVIPPTGDLTLAQLTAVLKQKWGVAVTVGTYEEQRAEVLSRPEVVGQPPPPVPFVTKSAWSKPNAPAKSPTYRAVLDAFEGVNTAIGGLPKVLGLRFLGVDYQLTGRSFVKASDEAGVYNPDKKTITMWTDVFSKTNAMALTKNTGDRTGVVFDSPSSTSSITANVVHELGHALEQHLTTIRQDPKTGARRAGPDPDAMNAFMAAAGWFVAPLELYDPDQNVVRDAIAKKAPAKDRPKAFRIDKSNWDSKPVDAPMTSYALTGPSEDFAETLNAFVRHPAALAKRSPGRFKFMQQRKVREWAKPGALEQPARPPAVVDRPPVPGTITASALRIRKGPGTTFPSLGTYTRGQRVDLLRRVEGEAVEGNRSWLATDRGWIAAAFVRAEAAVPE